MLDADAIRQIARVGRGREVGAGGKTLQRNAILNALVRQGRGQGSSKGERAGLLEGLVELALQHGASTSKVFYSRSTDAVKAAESTQAVEKFVQANTFRWGNGMRRHFGGGFQPI